MKQLEDSIFYPSISPRAIRILIAFLLSVLILVVGLPGVQAASAADRGDGVAAGGASDGTREHPGRPSHLEVDVGEVEDGFPVTAIQGVFGFATIL